MKHVGLMMVVVGCSLAAAYGTRNTDDIVTRLADEGKAAMTAQAADEAFAAYCASRKAEKLEPADGCKSDDDKTEPEAAKPEAPASKAPTRDELISQGEAELAALLGSTEALPKKAAEARAAWLAAKKAALVPGATAATLPAAPSARERLNAWLAMAGLPAAIGLLLIVAGAVVTRKANRAEALADAPVQEGEAAPRDFGESLRDFRDAVASMAESMNPEDSPKPSHLEETKQRIEALQFDKLEPLIDSGARVQARFGIAGFASIYGPLAGGERSLNRAWSALVDEHWPEACKSVNFASAQIADAVAELEKQLA